MLGICYNERGDIMLFEKDNYQEKINKIREALNEAGAVFIGAGAGLSTAAGYTYSGERFDKYFSDFQVITVNQQEAEYNEQHEQKTLWTCSNSRD